MLLNRFSRLSPVWVFSRRRCTQSDRPDGANRVPLLGLRIGLQMNI